jgi:hypothetical protein
MMAIGRRPFATWTLSGCTRTVEIDEQAEHATAYVTNAAITAPRSQDMRAG